MLALFKGELTYHEIMYELPKKRLYDLRLARINRLMEEQKDIEKQQKAQERQNIHDQILAK